MEAAQFFRPPTSFDDQPEEIRKLVEKVRKRKKEMETVHKQYRDKWDRFEALYRGYDDLKNRVRDAPDQDRRRGVVLDAARGWGEQLVIPMAFATIETIVPRILSRPPKPVEIKKVLAYMEAAPNPQEGYRDLFWVLINSAEFMFNH
jgi:hypothetical protein